jgi:hypothetical protein
VTRVRASFVRSAPSPAPPRTVSVASSPPIITRVAWGANERLRRDNPEIARAARYVVVHHTAGTNSYSRAQSAAIVRGIMQYHVQGNGWDDIGYNFLVDKYGQVFEGRYGGITRAVVGAHAQGFNTGSVGIAVIGSYGSSSITAAARAALVRLIAWRMDVAHVDPLSFVTALSAGNPRFPAGAPVVLRAVSGHRDTGFTSCPGNALYAMLTSLAVTSERTGAPKIYAPVVTTLPGGGARFTATLSDPVPWTVTITDASGIAAASGFGTGESVDWTWDGAGASGGYRYTIAAPGARPVTGTVRGKAATLTLTQLRVAPLAITPNSDGQGDPATVSYLLGASATVSARLLDADGRVLASFFTEPQSAGRHTFQFTADNVPDGNYDLVLTAADTRGKEVRAGVTILVSRTLSKLVATRDAISPNGDRVADAVGFRFTLAEPATVRLRILSRTSLLGATAPVSLPAGAGSVSWNGKRGGKRLPDGVYAVELEAASAAATVAQPVRVRVDVTRPRLTFVSLRPLRFRVNEPGRIVVTADGKKTVVTTDAPGTYTVSLAVTRTLRAVAWDRAGNRSAVLRSGR